MYSSHYNHNQFPSLALVLGVLCSLAWSLRSFVEIWQDIVASYELHVFFRCLSAVCCAQMYTAGGM